MLGAFRDEIEDTIKPRVERLRDAFNAKYGDASGFKESVISTYGKGNALRSALITVQTLQTQMGVYTSSALARLAGIPNLQFDFEFGYAVEAHKQYQEGLGKQAQIGLAMLHVEIAIAAYTIAATTVVTTAALAFAAIGAAVAIFVAVVAIIKSIEQEREIRDTLRENKADLLAAERQINDATAGIISTQKDICRDVMVPLSKTALAGAAFSVDFFWFMMTLEAHGVFVTDPNLCTLAYIYEVLTDAYLKSTVMPYLDFLIEHVKLDIAELRQAVEDARVLDSFAQTLENEVLVHAKQPSAIFAFVQQHKPSMLNTLFGSLFELYVYLAKNPLLSRTCYWGVSLEPFRSGAATASNYLVSSVVPPCSSPEIATQTASVTSDVAANYRPCRMVNRASFVRDVSGMLRYLAHNDLSAERCYWGYDLAAIRAGSLTDAQLNDADFDYNDLDLLTWEQIDATSLTFIKDYWCSHKKICNNDAWINFLLCMVNPSWSSVVGSCAGVPNMAACHVDASANQC